MGQEQKNREFRLPAGEGREKIVAVRRFEDFNSLTPKLEKEGLGTQGAEHIISLFKEARVDAVTGEEAGDGQTRRPHLLIAGGFARDLVLGKTPNDIDFATSLPYPEIAKLFSQKYAKEIADGRINIKNTGGNFGICIVTFRDLNEMYEIAMFREDGEYQDGRHPEEVTHTRRAGIDADRRDFTINGLFYNPYTGDVIDFVGGLNDIDEKLLRFIGSADERIGEDAVRMLRYVRFQLRLGFKPDRDAVDAIRRHAGDLQKIPVERIVLEINKTMETAKAGEMLRTLREYSLLKEFLPEVDALADCPQGPPYHMEGDVFEHTAQVADGIAADAPSSLKWAAIFHDISKPETRAEQITAAGEPKVSFLEHAEQGVVKVGPILNRLKFSGDDSRDVRWLVENHMQAFNFTSMRPVKAANFAKHPLFPALMDLATADHAGATCSSHELQKSHQEEVDGMRTRYAELKAEAEKNSGAEAKVKKAINGNEVMTRYAARYGRRPDGVLIGKILKQARETIAERAILESEQALLALDEVIDSLE